MHFLQDLSYSDIVAWLALFGVMYLLSQQKQDRRRRLSKHQKMIDEYYENMRWLGFKDNQIADMIHEFTLPEQLAEANKNARNIKQKRLTKN